MKSIRLLSLLVFATVCVLPVAAQWRVGFQAGYTHNSLTTESGYFYDRRYVALGGFTAGVPVQYVFNDWLAVQAEVSYVQKNYGMRRSGFYDALREDRTNHYLSVPLFARFSFVGQNCAVFWMRDFMPAAGWPAGVRGQRSRFLRRTRRKTICPALATRQVCMRMTRNMRLIHVATTVSREAHWWAWGWSIVSLPYGLSWPSAAYHHSLTDMQKDYMRDRVPRYLNTFLFQVGVLFTLGSN